jgi:hypothetical protein
MRLTERETVAMETPARRATSRMLTAAGRSRLDGFFLEPLTGKEILRFPAVSQVRLNREERQTGFNNRPL